MDSGSGIRMAWQRLKSLPDASYGYSDETKTTKTGTCETITWGPFVYHDPFGSQNTSICGFDAETVTYSGSCPGTNTPSLNATTRDGSALPISVSDYNSILITSPRRTTNFASCEHWNGGRIFTSIITGMRSPQTLAGTSRTPLALLS